MVATAAPEPAGLSIIAVASGLLLCYKRAPFNRHEPDSEYVNVRHVERAGTEAQYVVLARRCNFVGSEA